MNAELKRELKKMPESVKAGEPDGAFLAAVRQEAKRREGRQRVSFWKFLLRQARFAPWRLWLAQTALLACAAAFLFSSESGEIRISAPRAARLLAFSAALVFLSMLPVLRRSVRCRMEETEAAAYFSVGGLLAARLLILNAGNALMLLALSAIASAATPLGAGNAFIYLAVPFLATGSACLWLFRRLPRPGREGACAVLGALITGSVQLAGELMPQLFCQETSAEALLLCAALLLVYLFESFRAISGFGTPLNA